MRVANSGSPIGFCLFTMSGALPFLFANIFGEAGKHARSAVGVSELPLGAPVEVDTRKAIALAAYLAVTEQRYSRDALAGHPLDRAVAPAFLSGAGLERDTYDRSQASGQPAACGLPSVGPLSLPRSRQRVRVSGRGLHWCRELSETAARASHDASRKRHHHHR